MGLRAVHAIVGLALVSLAAMVAGVLQPQHFLFLTSSGSDQHVLSLWTHLMSVRIKSAPDTFCGALRRAKLSGRLDWCSHLDSVTDPRVVEQEMCSGVLAGVWPTFCHGLRSAYSMGEVVMAAVVMDIILVFFALSQILDCGSRRAGQKSRRLSIAAQSVGVCGVLCCLVFYWVEVIRDLGGSSFGPSLSVHRKTGFCAGFVLLCTGVLLQLLVLGLLLPLEAVGRLEATAGGRDYGAALQRSTTPAPGCRSQPVLMM